MSATETLTLADFLLARIDEDEVKAREIDTYLQDGKFLQVSLTRRNEDGTRTTRDVQAYDPARVLAECEAKRRIVALHGEDESDYLCQSGNYLYAPCATIRALALPYAEHPDFRPQWRP